MVQNLALPGGTTYVGTYSNFPSGESTFTLPGSSTGWVDNNSIKSVYNGTHIGQGDGNGNIPEENRPQADNTSTNTGGYYSYPAAAAKELGNQTTNYYNSPFSICPRNWRLPSWVDKNGDITPGGDFGELTDGYITAFHNWNINAFSSTNFNLFQSAYTSYCYSSGCPDSTQLNLQSRYWSSTISTETWILALATDYASGLYAGGAYPYWGFSIRCVVGGCGRGQIRFTSVIFSYFSLHECCKKYNTSATSTS